MADSPRLWPNPPSNSPLPFPHTPMLFTMKGLYPLSSPIMPKKEEIGLQELCQFIHNSSLEDGRVVGDLINTDKCRPLLIAGELANPYRLCDIGAPNMPLIPVRIENICRTWADSLDARDVNPGIHHVTIVRSPGWWEVCFLTLLEPTEMKRLVQWLDGPNPNTWVPKRLAEGTIRLEDDLHLSSPNLDDISWDGVAEKINVKLPPANGPAIDLSSVIVPINTRSGCYNSRGRVIRCVHSPQTEFHEKLFRRGSSFKWSDMLNFL